MASYVQLELKFSAAFDDSKVNYFICFDYDVILRPREEDGGVATRILGIVRIVDQVRN